MGTSGLITIGRSEQPLFRLSSFCLEWSSHYLRQNGLLFVNEKTARGRARGLACGPHCVLRQ